VFSGDAVLLGLSFNGISDGSLGDYFNKERDLFRTLLLTTGHDLYDVCHLLMTCDTIYLVLTEMNKPYTFRVPSKETTVANNNCTARLRNYQYFQRHTKIFI